MDEKDKQAIKLADDFMALNASGFQLFWATVAMEWNQEDGDLDAGWFYYSKGMSRLSITAIGALHSAVVSGKRAGG